MSEQKMIQEQGEGLLVAARDAMLAGLLESGTLTFKQTANGTVASTADSANRTSVKVSRSWAEALKTEVAEERAAGQTLGANFEHAVCGYVKATFPQLSHLRPGTWDVELIGNRGNLHGFAQYEHLHVLDEAIRENPKLRTVLGNSYAISPDVIVSREPESDEELNSVLQVVDAESAVHADLRATNQPNRLLHAVVSCKWTMRSDRAQNSRSEALNLIGNRKGRTPHILVVTAEPLPSRIASLALGTGEFDCVYHLALPELVAAVEEHCDDSSQELLASMIEGKRLKDLTDLPLDLAV